MFTCSVIQSTIYKYWWFFVRTVTKYIYIFFLLNTQYLLLWVFLCNHHSFISFSALTVALFFFFFPCTKSTVTKMYWLLKCTGEKQQGKEGKSPYIQKQSYTTTNNENFIGLHCFNFIHFKVLIISSAQNDHLLFRGEGNVSPKGTLLLETVFINA